MLRTACARSRNRILAVKEDPMLEEITIFHWKYYRHHQWRK